MAEDDDDEAFGDFSFAAFQSSSQSNGLNSLADDDEDDEWGDFMKSPQQSKPSGPSLNGNHQLDNYASPTTWVKPSGALPLSIFGDAEEEKEEEVHSFAVAGDSNHGKSNGIAGDLNSSIVVSGASNSHSFGVNDLYNSFSPIKTVNKAGMDPAGEIDAFSYISSNQNVAGSSVTESKNVDSNDRLGISNHSQLANTSHDEEFSFKSYVPDPPEKPDIFGGWTQEFNGFSSSWITAPQIVQTSSSDLDMNDQKQQLDGSATAIDDDDDDGWEFQDAYSESQAQEVKNNVDLAVHEASERSNYSTGNGIGSNKSLDQFGTSNGSIDFFAMSTEPVDYFVNSSGIPSKFQEVDLFGVQPSIATLNGFTSDTNTNFEQNNNKGLLDHRTDAGIEELDEDFGDFSAASAETEPNPGEMDVKLKYQKGAIPLSIFGDEEPESGGSPDVQDLFMHQSTSDQRNNHTPTTVFSVNDLISNLYSQAEQTSSINTSENPSETHLNLSGAVSNSNLPYDDDDLDDSSWDFKDASQMRVDPEASVSGTGDTYASVSSKLNLRNYLDFYCKLKEELCFVAKCHIETLKQARGNADVSIEDARAESLDSEFQLICKELEQMNVISGEGTSEDHLSGNSHLNEFAEVLLEPHFHRLESEYHLSQKLLLVQKDLGSAMELIRHANTMLKILTLGTLEEQKVYVSLWYDMISVCAQELKHGASIWNQAVEKHVQSQLLTQPQGRNFILALGEIYRVVVVLGASAKLYKPWILSGSVDFPAIYIVLEECHAVWSTSGLQEALSSVSAPTALDNTPLFKSIRHILHLDALKLQDYVFVEKESRCRLSILTAGVVPDLKMIMWGDEQCFVTLANLWANLLSRNPPKLPQLNLG